MITIDKEPDWTQIAEREARAAGRADSELRTRPRLFAAGGTAMLSLLFAGGYAVTTPDLSHIFGNFGKSKPAPGALQSSEFLEKISHFTVDDKTQIVVQGVDAKQRNEALAFSSSPLENLRGFKLGVMSTPSSQAALTCLTQAIYYEAAYEPLQGRRAVAQVVLNRMRHPSYPNSVCGVVYEGHTRRTGCQFSFTCDGSLLRPPAPGAWREAQAIAKAALAGAVEESVGTATHYHADYVLPKWAFTLGKMAKIGQHIFYRFNGRPGSAAAFSSGYAGNEFVPSLDFAALRARADEAGAMDLGEAAFSPGLTVAPHITDRHAENDVGGRLDTTRQWRLSIPGPVEASSRLRQTIEQTQGSAPTTAHVAQADTRGAMSKP